MKNNKEVVIVRKWLKRAEEPFKRLKPEKREKVLRAGIREFAVKGFDSASTNRIALDAGISKGSLFKYFRTKEQMFECIIDYIMEFFIVGMNEARGRMPSDIFERTRAYVATAISFCVKEPEAYRLLVKTFTNLSVGQYAMTMARWMPGYLKLLFDIYSGADFSGLRYGRLKTIGILTDVLASLELYALVEAGEDASMEKFGRVYLKKLDSMLGALKYGLKK